MNFENSDHISARGRLMKTTKPVFDFVLYGEEDMTVLCTPSLKESQPT
jgi:hypothetical protein